MLSLRQGDAKRTRKIRRKGGKVHPKMEERVEGFLNECYDTHMAERADGEVLGRHRIAKAHLL